MSDTGKAFAVYLTETVEGVTVFPSIYIKYRNGFRINISWLSWSLFLDWDHDPDSWEDAE